MMGCVMYFVGHFRLDVLVYLRGYINSKYLIYILFFSIFILSICLISGISFQVAE